MRHFPFFTALAVFIAATPVLAETPQQIQAGYSAEATRQQPGFKPDGKRGESLYRQNFAVSDKMPACTSCHTDKMTAAGRHAVTGKAIQPLAPQANAERFSDAAKVEKWFGRNCKEVLGRVCTAAEKADFIQYALEVR